MAPLPCKNARMNWNDLRYFIAAVRRGSYSAAAQELGVARTTVARRIQALEKRLKQTLFVFHNNRFTLTEFGQSLFDRAQDLEQAMDGLQQELDIDQAVQGDLRIAAPLGLGAEFVPAFAALSKRYPGLCWELVNAEDPLASLNMRQADMAIGLGDNCPVHLRRVEVLNMPRALYAANTYLKRYPADVALVEHQWLYWGESLSGSQAARWMAREIPAEATVVARLNSWHAMKLAVTEGLGVAPLWCCFADPMRGISRIGEVQPDLTMPLAIFAPQDRPMHARTRAAIGFLQQELSSRLRIS